MICMKVDPSGRPLVFYMILLHCKLLAEVCSPTALWRRSIRICANVRLENITRNCIAEHLTSSRSIPMTSGRITAITSP